MSRQSRFVAFSLLAVLLAAYTGPVSADSLDWVNVDYVAKHANIDNTSGAQQSIANKAGTSAKSGPWSVTNKQNNIKPPSGDVRDYLSWAPYHWPDCNWCSKGTNHLSGPNQGDDDTDDSPDDDDDGQFQGDDPYENGGNDEADVLAANLALFSTNSPGAHSTHSRMLRFRRSLLGHGRHDALQQRGNEYESYLPTDNSPTLPDAPGSPSAPGDVVLSSIPAPSTPPLPTTAPDVGPLPISSSSTWKTVHGTPAPAQAPAKTTKSKCTPSPAKSLAPSATWTTCPYVLHDGKVNPDVRQLTDTSAIASMSQAVLFNAVAFALQKTKVYSQNAAKFIDTFFLASQTAMNPSLNYGQQVRGPGKAQQMGTYTGILDLRGTVKVVNSIQILKAAGSPDWTSARDKAMADWMKLYVSWLQNSALGKDCATKANNHLTFYVSQLAAAKMYIGDSKGAQDALKNYFSHQFLDQIAKSGEQPFEAVRTRPYHYRCFNLEAMITNAKLGDQLGLNLWTAKSKYGATIQTALDYVMALDPKEEDMSDIFPHVAAVAAAYGDPNGKYAAFLKKHKSGYASEPFWFYDQSAALPNSPAGRAAKHRRELGLQADEAGNAQHDLISDAELAKGMMMDATDQIGSGEIPFECPAVFQWADKVELEDGLFVTCDKVEPLYDLRMPEIM